MHDGDGSLQRIYAVVHAHLGSEEVIEGILRYVRVLSVGIMALHCKPVMCLSVMGMHAHLGSEEVIEDISPCWFRVVYQESRRCARRERAMPFEDPHCG